MFFLFQFLLCILFHFSSSSFLLFHLTSTPSPPFCFSPPFLPAPASLHHGSFYILLSSLFFLFSIFSFSPFSFHLSLCPIPSFSFSSTYPFSSLIHPASIYFLSLASQYTPLLFSHPSSSLPLFSLLYSLLSIFSVLQSPLHSPSFFSLFSMSSLLLLILFFIFLFFFPSSFFHDPPLHPPSILLSSSSYNYPILIFLYFFCTYSSSTLFSPSLSLSFIPSLSSPSCCWFSSYHPRPSDLLFYLHLYIHQNSLIFSMLLIHVSGWLCQIARLFYCIYMHTYMYLYTYITVFNTNFCFKTNVWFQECI